jgi:hypothetical protein
MSWTLSSLQVDGRPVDTVRARFPNEIQVSDSDAYKMAYDEELVLVLRVRVGPPSAKELKKDGTVRVNPLIVKELTVVPEGDEAEIRSRFLEDAPAASAPNPVGEHPQLPLEGAQRPAGAELEAVVVRQPDTTAPDPRTTRPDPEPEPEPEPEDDEVVVSAAPVWLTSSEPSEERVAYDEGSAPVGRNGQDGRVVGDARGAGSHDPMLARFLGSDGHRG